MDKKTNVEIFFKIDGLETYITDLETLNSVLEKTSNNTKDLKEDTSKYEKEVKKTEKSVTNANKSQKSFSDTMSSAPGPIGALSNSVKGLSVAFKALLANPIILVFTGIVTVVTALFKAFTSTKAGGEALNRVMAGLGATFDVFRDVLVKISQPLIKLFTDPKQGIIDLGNTIKENIINRFVGLAEFIPQMGEALRLLFNKEFGKAAETAGNAILKITTGVEGAIGKLGEIGSEIANEANEATRLTGVLQKLNDRERELNETRAEQNRLLVETRLRADDVNLSTEERLKAIEDVGKSETEILNQQLALERERLNALQGLANLSDSDAETLDKLSQQRIKITQLEEESLRKQKTIQRERNGLLKEQEAINAAAEAEANQKKAEDELKAAEQLQREADLFEELRKSKLTQLELELEDRKKKYDADIIAAGENQELIKLLTEKFNQDILDINKRSEDQNKTLIEQSQKTITDILNSYSEKQYETEEQRLLDELELRYLADVEKLKQAGATKEQLEALTLAYEENVTKITKKGEEDRAILRRENAVKGVELFSDLLSAFQDFNNIRTKEDEVEARKQFERNKKFSIAQALISTGLAVNAALTAGGNPAKLATGVQFVEAGIALATGLAQVAKIRATTFEGGGGGGGGINPNGINPQALLDQRNTELQGGGGGTTTLRQGGDQPVRAYVVLNDINSAQQVNQNILNLSKL